MARTKNNVDSVQLTLSVTQAVRDMLDRLSDSGFYGKNAADTAALLLREKLRDLSTQFGSPGVHPPAPLPAPRPAPGF